MERQLRNGRKGEGTMHLQEQAPSTAIAKSLIEEGHQHLLAYNNSDAIRCFTRAELIGCRSKNNEVKILAVMGLMMAYCQSETQGVAKSLSSKLEVLLAIEHADSRAA